MSEPDVLDEAGRIFEIQRFSIHDGPGIRTTVFLQGCPLRCVWCHNPEGQSGTPLLSFVESKCIGCGNCFRACPNGAHRRENERHILDRSACRVCGICASECYSGALQIAGRAARVSEVLATVVRDKPFYDSSGGGLTLSGGEPLAQPRFALAILSTAREAGIRCCMETCGFATQDDLLRAHPLVDLFLFDIKEADEQRHLEVTGVSIQPIMRNLRALYAAGANIRLRLPIVPGHNDRPDFFEEIAALYHEMPRIEGLEIMPYHRLGEGKLTRFDLEARMAIVEPPSPERVAEWQDNLEGMGVKIIR